MAQKSFFTVFFSLALLLFVGGADALAQTQPLSGVISMTQADGTVAPLEGATVEVFRTDIKSEKPVSSTTTNKKGQFNFAGFLLGNKYSISVSAPNMSPVVRPVQLGQEVKLTLSAGDGKKLTAAEATQPPPDQGGNPAAAGKASADAKKIDEENKKIIAENAARRKKVEDSTAFINKVLKEGNDAYNQNNLDVAIAKYDEGYNADPDFVGSAPTLLKNKALALRQRGNLKYNAAIKQTNVNDKTAGKAEAAKDYQASVDAFQKSLDLLKTAPASTDATEAKNRGVNTYDALAGRAESYRRLILADSEKATDSLTAFEEYIAAESDAAKKQTAQLSLAEALMQTGDFDRAIPTFQKVLETQPDNPDALYYIGISYISTAHSVEDKTAKQAKMQEGLNYLQRFADLSLDAKYQEKVADAKANIEELKKRENIAPQKGAGKPAKKKT